MQKSFVAAVVLAGLLTTSAPAAFAPAETANASVGEWARGAYEYRSLVDGKLRGRETFLLTQHPDGSRTMRAFTDIFARGVTANVVLRAAADFRPLDAFVSIYTQGKLKGSAFYTLDGTRLRSVINGPSGSADTTETVPADLSFATHPLALDGWHRWMLPSANEVRGTLLNIQGDADFTKPMIGKLQSVTIAYRGEQEQSVPAGKFRVHHFVMDGEVDLWITLPDRLLVRSAWPRFKSEYVLSEWQQSASGDLLRSGSEN